MQYITDHCFTQQHVGFIDPTRHEIQQRLLNMFAKQLHLQPEAISATTPLSQYGLDSIDAVTLAGDLEEWLTLQLPSTLLWDYPTIEEIARYLDNSLVARKETPDESHTASRDGDRSYDVGGADTLAQSTPVAV
jgi:acyl carrier protein